MATNKTTKPHAAQSRFIGGEIPAGFIYETEFISNNEEQHLLTNIQTLPFKNFQYHGFEGNRRIVDYGWSYNFESKKLTPGRPIPEFLLSIRERAATRMALPADSLSEALVTQYPAGSAIGWHRDVPQFDVVFGISLLSACIFRLRLKQDSKWLRYSCLAEPCSMYILSGPARRVWEHSIPAVEMLRYSITFRTRRSAFSGS
jgi:alkylated DNA repair dioxygenase AlkB